MDGTSTVESWRAWCVAARVESTASFHTKPPSAAPFPA